MSRLSPLLAGIATVIGLMSAANALPAPPSAGFSQNASLEYTYQLFFENGKTKLTPEASDILRSVAHTAHTTRQAQVRVMVPGTGAALAQERARSIKAELVRYGAESQSIIAANLPVDSAHANADPVIHAWLDRRAVITVSPIPAAAGDEQAKSDGRNIVAAR